VSNFTVAHLEALRETAVAWPPAVNQVELITAIELLFAIAFTLRSVALFF
jgi:diketogulonate reductase-like aldo/keto reductase